MGHISIHAPREGSDRSRRGHQGRPAISIHAPREGSDLTNTTSEPSEQAFLSTLPARGATAGCAHPPRYRAISIHAPREGSDRAFQATERRAALFLSTLPARGATQQDGQDLDAVAISIHAPREGSDRKEADKAGMTISISIHAPREGSDWYWLPDTAAVTVFLSTLPARGATVCGFRAA